MSALLMWVINELSMWSLFLQPAYRYLQSHGKSFLLSSARTDLHKAMEMIDLETKELRQN